MRTTRRAARGIERGWRFLDGARVSGMRGGVRARVRRGEMRRLACAGVADTHSARVSTLPIDFAATEFRGLFSPTWGHPVGAPHQFNSHRSSHRTRPRWRSAAQPRSSRASRAPRCSRSSPPRSSPAACPAAWRGSRRGSPCRPSDRRTTSGTPHTPTSGSRCVPMTDPPHSSAPHSATYRHQRRGHCGVDIVPEPDRARRRRRTRVPRQTLTHDRSSATRPDQSPPQHPPLFPNRLRCRRRWR